MQILKASHDVSLAALGPSKRQCDLSHVDAVWLELSQCEI